jgi:hypothetical protein
MNEAATNWTGMMVDPTRFFTPQQLVDRWAGAVTVETLANWRAKGVGPRFTKIGSRVRYSRDAVLEYETANQVGGDA